MLCTNLNQNIMKINECSVIDNKVIDDMIAECLHPELYESLLHIKQQLKPLEPIVRDAYLDGMYTDGDWEYCSNKYINKTEI